MATAAVHLDDRDLECPVCHQPFRTPKILPCGHTLCLSPCLHQLSQGKKSLRCPECRAEHQLPRGTVSGFPTNISIMRMMKKESVTDEPKRSGTVCPICSRQELIVQCFHCTLLICEMCRDNHTKELRDKIREELVLVTTAHCGQSLPAKMALNTLLISEKQSMEEKVNKAVEMITQAIQDKKDQLLKDVDKYINNVRKEITTRYSTATNEYHTFVNNFCKKEILKLSDSDASYTQSQLFRIREDLQEWRSKLQLMTDGIPKITGANLVGDVPQIVNEINILGMSNTRGARTESTQCGLTSCNIPDVETEKQNLKALVESDHIVLKRCIGRGGTGAGEFKGPTCLAVCPVSGNIVVGDNGNGRLQVFSEEGQYQRSLYKEHEGKKIRFQNIKDLAVDTSGTVIVLDNERMSTISLIGQPLVTSFLVNSDGFIRTGGPRKFAVDRKCQIHVLVCDGFVGRIDIYNKEGARLSTYSASTSTCFRPGHISIASDGTVYVTDMPFDMGQEHYYVFNKNQQLVDWGELKCRTYSGEYIYRVESCTSMSGQMSIIQDKYILTTDLVKHCVFVFDFNWKVVKMIGTPGYCRGQLHRPPAAVVTRRGELVVLSNDMLHFFKGSP